MFLNQACQRILLMSEDILMKNEVKMYHIYQL